MQILDRLPRKYSDGILCNYVNQTAQMQVVRITNIEDWYFERVVFPGERLLFAAPPAAHLEIHTNELPTAILADSIPCLALQVAIADERVTALN